jgi:hypothetical protein
MKKKNILLKLFTLNVFILYFTLIASCQTTSIKQEPRTDELITLRASFIADKTGPYAGLSIQKIFNHNNFEFGTRFGYMRQSEYVSYVTIQNMFGYNFNNDYGLYIVPTWFKGTIPMDGYYTPTSLVFRYTHDKKTNMELWVDGLIGDVNVQILLTYNIVSFKD